MDQNTQNVQQPDMGQQSEMAQQPDAAQGGNTDSGWTVQYSKNGMPVGASYFKGVGFERHAETEVSKGETTLIWVFFFLGLVVGALLCWKVNAFLGIFIGMMICVLGMLGVGAKAFIRQGDHENLKTFLLAMVIFGGVFLFIGIIFFSLFMAGVF